MIADLYPSAGECGCSRKHSRRQGTTHKFRQQADDGFVCSHCRAYVSSTSLLSGVQNRNHCPYCLHSRHVDLNAAGDRLSACKSMMQPVGLTLKFTAKKYVQGHGELMLVHRCSGCSRLSINRIAADDDTASLMAVHQGSFHLTAEELRQLMLDGIHILTSIETHLVSRQLFGE